MSKDIYYEEISRNFVTLSEKEEISLLEEYDRKRKETELTLLKDPVSRLVLEKLIDEKPVKLSRKFNKKKKGHNVKLSDTIIQIWNEVKDKPVWDDNDLINLQSVNWTKKVFEEIGCVCSGWTYEKVKVLNTRLSEIENRLVCSVLKAGKEIAYKYNVPGVDVDDIIQEANEGFVEAVRLYDINYKTKEGNRIKFCTYAYNKAENKIKEFIMNTSRLVRLPRSRLELLFLAIRSINSLDPEKYTIEKLQEKMNESLDTPISTEEVYSILELLQSSYHSLDVPANVWGENKGQALKDLLPSSDPTPEKHLSKVSQEEHVRRTVKEILSPYKDLTYAVVYCKYLSGDNVRSYDDLSRSLKYRGFTNKLLSREGVRQMEIKALKRLAKRAPELKEFLYEK